MSNQKVSAADEASPLLFQPLTLRSVTARNRIMVAPMCQYAAIDGQPTNVQMVHLGGFAVGGAGIVFCEETAVEARGRKTHRCTGIYNEQHVLRWREITDFIRRHGALSGMQLGHSGRLGSVHTAAADWRPLRAEDAEDGLAPWTAIAPSPVASTPGHPVPHEMSHDDIRVVIDAWAEATRLTEEAGFDIVEIHGAHGYLIHQFLSPLANHRTDGYGGDRAGRMRFALEITEVVRKNWPESKPLFFRVSAVDGAGGVWDIEDTIVLARELKKRGVDVVDVSSGGIHGDSAMPVVRRVPGYHLPFSERIRREADIPTVAVGLITEAHQAESILQNGQGDIIAMARQLMWNPHWPIHTAAELGADAYSLLPDDYASRLRRRDEVSRLKVNQEGGHATSEEVRLIGLT